MALDEFMTTRIYQYRIKRLFSLIETDSMYRYCVFNFKFSLFVAAKLKNKLFVYINLVSYNPAIITD